jgi:peptidoglycan/xylan/chitin deacetylase (PgdA/CDA1 family)
VETSLKGRVLSFDEPSGTWKPIDSYDARAPGAASADLRVYLEDSTRGSYANLVMVRDTKGYGTTPLFPPETTVYEPFPATDEPVSFTNFTHGSRIRRREVSIVFNAVDSAEGLTGILNTLSAYRIRTTFFVNGEFIRRYPDAVREIAESGHEVGSLFSTYFNMTDSRFGVDREFVKQGLARNEDDYFATTGRELSLLWHAPYYFVSSDIIAAAAEMNYTYVGRDLDSYDWVLASDFNKARGIYFPAAQLVDRIISQKKPGSIIPIQVGMVGGPRDDYLFQKLDLIINQLILLGYQIVPVSTLMEHAR